MITIERYHDISCGHRVVGHEGKCVGLHGHNYRITFTCAVHALHAGYSPGEGDQGLDALGRVIDFGVIKSRLCMWLENNWDHRMLLWESDPMIGALYMGAGWLSNKELHREGDQLRESLCLLPFNPTAENMAHHLLTQVALVEMAGTGVDVIAVRVEETRKCSAVAVL